MYQIPSFVFVNIWQCLSDCYLYFLNIECRMGYVCMILVCTVIFYTGLRHLCFFLYCHSVCFSTGSLPLYFVNPVINIRFTLYFVLCAVPPSLLLAYHVLKSHLAPEVLVWVAPYCITWIILHLVPGLTMCAVFYESYVSFTYMVTTVWTSTREEVTM